MSDQRLTTHQGNMDGLVFSHEFQHTLDQRVSAQIMELAERDFTPRCVSP